ncbi:MAG: glutathione S-transferase family protein [Myxococcota bacterium]
MKLYHHPFAPNPRKVRVYIAEKGLPMDYEVVEIGRGENRTPAFLAKNPMGSVPVLEMDDGGFLTESLAIMEYLEELHPEPPMIGTTPLERARTHELERLADVSVLSRVGRIFVNTNPAFPKEEQSAESAAQARAGLPNAQRIINDRNGENEFVAGGRPTNADCTLFAALELGKVAGVTVGDEYPHLRRWHASFSRRPSARA